jgi:hypothetical protein
MEEPGDRDTAKPYLSVLKSPAEKQPEGGRKGLAGLRMAGQLMGALRLASLTLNLVELRRAVAGPNMQARFPGSPRSTCRALCTAPRRPSSS